LEIADRISPNLSVKPIIIVARAKVTYGRREVLTDGHAGSRVFAGDRAGTGRGPVTSGACRVRQVQAVRQVRMMESV
jgi:hypothetical protein